MLLPGPLSSAISRRQALPAASSSPSSSLPSPTAKASSQAAAAALSTVSRAPPLSSSSSSSSLQQLESSLSRFSLLLTCERVMGVPRVYSAAALLLCLCLCLRQGWGLSQLTLLLGFLYPLYCSLRCLSSLPERGSEQPPVAEQQRLWLIYWVLFGLLSFSESLSDLALGSWLPLYGPLKLAALLWCFLPSFRGSAFLYDVLLQPFIARHRERMLNVAQDVHDVAAVVARQVRKQSIQMLGAVVSSSLPPSPASAPAALRTAQS